MTPVSDSPSSARLDALIAPDCRAAMRRDVAEYGGVEVLWIGRVNAEQVVETVEAHAFGTFAAVPALLPYARPGDVVMHNHPSGHLEPSDADIGVASELGSRGIGSYIVNNDLTSVRIIVRPLPHPERKPLKIEALQGWLKAGGRVATRLEGFEVRPPQITMLGAVGEAFNQNGIAVIEAGTGTGKSMAYLLPAIAWALRNEEKVIIATGTINLQEQLIHKDLPLLMQATGLKFSATLMKGRNNYLCRRKAAYLNQHPEFLDTDVKDGQLREIQAWIETTQEGSLEDLPFTPDDDVWERVMSEADNCLRVRCPFYQKCFYYNARRRAARAHLLVVNHHLLMADLAVRAETGNYTASAVLPPCQRLIIDEAHHLEEVATQYLGVRATRAGLRWALRRLMQPRSGEGLLQQLAEHVHRGVWPLLPEEEESLSLELRRELPLQHHEVRFALDEASERIATTLDPTTARHPTTELKLRIRERDLTQPLWAETIEPGLRAILTAARPYLEGLRRVGRTLARFLEDGDPETATPILELQSALSKLEGHIQKVMRFLGEAPGTCRWVELRRRGNGRPPDLAFCLAPLEIAPELRERVLRRFPTVVMTSATLAVDQKLDFFLRQVGAEDPLRLSLLGAQTLQPGGAPAEPAPAAPLVTIIGNPESDPLAPVSLDDDSAIESPGGEAEIVAVDALPDGAATPDPDEPEAPPPVARSLTALILDTPFDYDRQVFLGVPLDLPDPTEGAYEPALSGFLGPALEATRGRAFVLFTAYTLLDRVFKTLAPRLEGQGYPCLRQGQTSRSTLTEAFRRDIGSVLFATSSFWEGVDVPGEALSCLVLTRLPFRVPGEPLIEARVEALRARGLDPFMHLIVPQAIIRFRQGFGRLIRSKTDRGAVLICDRRVSTRGYGQLFLRSLPTQRVHHAPQADLLEALGAFFSQAQDPEG